MAGIQLLYFAAANTTDMVLPSTKTKTTSPVNTFLFTANPPSYLLKYQNPLANRQNFYFELHNLILYLFAILKQALIIDLAAGNPDRTGRLTAVHHPASFAALRQHPVQRVPIRRVGVIDVTPVIVQVADPVVGHLAAAASVGADPVRPEPVGAIGNAMPPPRGMVYI